MALSMNGTWGPGLGSRSSHIKHIGSRVPCGLETPKGWSLWFLGADKATPGSGAPLQKLAGGIHWQKSTQRPEDELYRTAKASPDLGRPPSVPTAAPSAAEPSPIAQRGWAACCLLPRPTAHASAYTNLPRRDACVRPSGHSSRWGRHLIILLFPAYTRCLEQGSQMANI